MKQIKKVTVVGLEKIDVEWTIEHDWKGQKACLGINKRW